MRTPACRAIGASGLAMTMPLKVIFMGSDPLVLPLLDWLAGEGSALASIAAVYTQPDRPAGRGQKTEAGPIKQWAATRGVLVRQPEKLTPDECDWLAAQQADVALVLAYGHILKDEFIATPRFGISSNIDEEWALPDEDYFKLLGMYDLGRSSISMKKRFEEIVKKQISSQMASFNISSPVGGMKEQDQFFLEVWTELILHGRTMADAHVTVEGKKVDLRPDGTFTQRYALPVGDYKYEVTGVSKNKKHKITKTPAVKRFEKK